MEDDLFEVWDLTDDLHLFNQEDFSAPSSKKVGWGNGSQSKGENKKGEGEEKDGAVSLPMPTRFKLHGDVLPVYQMLKMLKILKMLKMLKMVKMLKI
jgi:hypothetical protein